MTSILRITLKGIFRDRVFQGIMVVALLFLFIPTISSLSMRQVTELSITLSLSLISFILLLLAVFLGGTSLWKDIEKRYTFSVLGLPLSRTSYILGRFLGNALFLSITALLLGAVSLLVVFWAKGLYPPARPVRWDNMMIAVLFDTLKYLLLVSVAFFFSSVSTSFFLPIFGTISLYLVGNASQEVYDYLHSGSDALKTLPGLVVKAASLLYYLIPNLAAFDYKLHAVYGLDIAGKGLALTALYWVVYTAIMLTLTAVVFSRREMK
jgi:Cu-processing system permease protein